MKSIRRELTWQLLLVIGVLGLIGGIATYVYVHRALQKQFDEALRAKALAMSRLVAWGKDGKLMLEIPQDALAEYRREHRPDYYEVWQPDGSVFAKSDSLRGGDLAHGTEGNGIQVRNMVLEDGRPGRAVISSFVPHSEADEPDDHDSPATAPVIRVRTPVMLALATDRVDLESALSHLSEGLMVVWGTMAVIAAALLAFTVKRGLMPLEQLSEQAGELHSGTLHSRFSTENLPAELSPIVERLNALLERIESAFERERRFTADAAHELRTPIAELRTLSEVILKWPKDRGDATKEFREVHAIARQMGRLVESLLAMGRGVRQQQEVEMREERLGILLQEAWRGYEGAAKQRELQMSWRIERGVTVTTDRMLLLPVLRNILSNAVEYSPAGGSVECAARRGESGVELTVLNQTEGLEHADVTHVFEPFWRKDRSRTGTNHSGLGLAVAAGYAELLGIGLEASLAEDGRFVMRAIFRSGIGASAAAPVNVGVSKTVIRPGAG